MDLQVVYSTRTGNTKRVAEAIAAEFGVTAQALGEVRECSAATVAIGYWVDKGHPDEGAKRFMEQLAGKKVFLFGTLGAEPDSDHARDCMQQARALVEGKNEVVGEFICQGKIDSRVVDMFRNLPADHPHAMTPEREARYAAAAKHPDEADLAAARKAARAALGK